MGKSVQGQYRRKSSLGYQPLGAEPVGPEVRGTVSALVRVPGETFLTLFIPTQQEPDFTSLWWNLEL